MAERCHHPDFFVAAAGQMALDLQWYLSSQVLPPVARLCEPIEETSPARLAECLGTPQRSGSRSGSGCPRR